MTTFDVSLDLGDMEIAGRLLAEDLSDLCTYVVRDTVKAGQTEALARRTWKNRTGKAEEKTKGIMLVEARGGALGELHSDVKYASYLDAGTEPHVIEGNPYLHFVWKGVPMTLRRVHHPGTKGDGYMGYAYLKMERFGQAEAERRADIIAQHLEQRLNRAA